MKLSKRLETVLLMTPDGMTAADIGTDHGLVPRELLRRGRYCRVIASDLRSGPLAAAEKTLREAGVLRAASLRLGDGLAPIMPAEADTILICGMGGALIRQILSEREKVARSAKTLILSPQSEIPGFREYLQTHGFAIRDERMVREDGKFYVIFRAEPGTEEPWTGADWAFGRILLERGGGEIRAFLKRERELTERALSAMEKAGGGRPEDRLEKENYLALIKEAQRRTDMTETPRNTRGEREAVMESSERLKDIEAFVSENEEAILRDIARLVKAPSIEGLAEGPGAPFGKGSKEALDTVLAIGREMGFHTVNCEGYMGYAQLGEGNGPHLATVTHVDVVPVGDGWHSDPFTMIWKEGYIIGRGVTDDKGPSILCLYALKYLKEKNIPLRYPVRALFGANEETGMGDLKYYLAHYEAPLFAFSPDADFPLIHGEKGLYQGHMVSRCKADRLVSLEGGVAANVVPGHAQALLRSEKTPAEADKVKVTREGELWKIEAFGVGGHASTPQGKTNAIGVLLEYLLKEGLVEGEERAFLEKAVLPHRSTDGSSLGIDARDELFTPLTAVSGVLGIREGHIYQSLDCRYPTSTSGKKITETVDALLGEEGDMVCDMDKVPFWKDPSSPEIRALMTSYREVTGDDTPSFSIGGGTYARAFPNAVAFGPEWMGRKRPAFAGTIHGADEAASVDELMTALKIYILSLIRLEELEL